MKEVYGSWDSSKPQHAWDYFAATDTDIPGNSGCGNIHFPANGQSDYDYENSKLVEGRSSFMNTSFPAQNSQTSAVNNKT